MPKEMKIFLQYFCKTHNHSEFYHRVLSKPANISAAGISTRGKSSPTRTITPTRDRSQDKHDKSDDEDEQEGQQQVSSLGIRLQ